MKIGIKQKVLLSFIILILTVLSVTLFYSYQNIKRDKEAYIYETSLGKAQDIANDINEKISLYISYLNLASSFNFEQKKLEKLLANNNEVKIIATKLNKSPFWNLNWNKTKINNNELEKLVRPKQAGQVQFYSLKIKDQNFFILQGVDKNKDFLIVIDDKPISSLLAKDSAFTNEVYSLNKTYPSPELNGVLKGYLNLGTKEILLDGVKFVMSFIKLTHIDLAVTSRVEKDKAYEAIFVLVYKVAFFGMILLGFALIFGVLFSRKLVNPILDVIKKTNEIAKGNFDTEIHIQSTDELHTLGTSVNSMSSKIKGLLKDKEDMIDELKLANQKLDDYAKNLEKMVAQRTEELNKSNGFLNAMINSLDQGLLVFDKDGNCSDVHTKSCEEIFNQELGQKTFSDLLNQTEDQKMAFTKWTGVLFGGMLPFKDAVALGPEKLEIGENSESNNYKNVSLDYYPMNNSEGALDNIVCVATDKTKEVKAQIAFEKEQAYVQCIMRIVRNKKQFLKFIEECSEINQSTDLELKKDAPNRQKLLMNYHTLNGGLALYSLYELRDQVRTIETILTSIEDHQVLENEALRELKINFEKSYEEQIQNFVNVFELQDKKLELSEQEILTALEEFSQDAKNPLYLFLRDILYKESIESYMKAYKELIPDLASKLNKNVLPLEIKGGDIKLEKDRFQDFFTNLVHLFRNCMDHGLESPSVRSDRNKPLKGLISVACKVTDNDFLIEVQDDGNGISAEKIREKTGDTKSSDEEVLYHIFDPEFSTNEEVTEISGRGVGMSAIKEVVESLNGSIKIKTQEGKGSQFLFKIPMS